MNISLKAGDKKKMLSAADMYEIMQRILLRENRIDRNREHLWTISLDTANRLLAIELVSMGSVNKTIVEPMEVFSVPLQKAPLHKPPTASWWVLPAIHLKPTAMSFAFR